MSEFVDTAGYIVIEPTRVRGDVVTQAKITRATQRPPQLSNGEIAIRLTVRVPAAAFSPIADVFVEIPEDLVLSSEVVVEAAS